MLIDATMPPPADAAAHAAFERIRPANPQLRLEDFAAAESLPLVRSLPPIFFGSKNSARQMMRRTRRCKRGKIRGNQGGCPAGCSETKEPLEAFQQFASEQGVCHRLLQPEEIFAPQMHHAIRA